MRKGNYRLMVAINKEIVSAYFSGKFNRARIVYSSRERAKIIGLTDDKIITDINGKRCEYSANTGASLQAFEDQSDILRYNWLRLLLIFDTEESMKASKYYGMAKPRQRKTKTCGGDLDEYCGNKHNFDDFCVMAFSYEITQNGHKYCIMSTEAQNTKTKEWFVLQRTQTIIS